MGPENEYRENEQAIFNEAIRQDIVRKPRRNYKPFQDRDKNFVNLLVVKFDLDSPMTVIHVDDKNNEFYLPYGNLGELIQEVFEEDRDKSMQPISTGKTDVFNLFNKMPAEFGRYIGDKVYVKTTFYPLISGIHEKRMVIATRYSNPTDMEQKRPFLEYWRAESRDLDDYLYGREESTEEPAGLIASGIIS